MPFFRSLDSYSPKPAPDLPWPVDGLAYVSTFMGPFSAGPIIGVISLDWRLAGIGFVMGICITFVAGLLSDYILDPLIVKFQRPLQKPVLRVLVNIVAFAFAIALCATAMLAPIAVLGLEEIRLELLPNTQEPQP